MLNLTSAALKVFLALDPCDMRKSFNGLHTLASDQLQTAPARDALFVFTNNALIYTLLANCRPHDLDPEDYLVEVIKRLPPNATAEEAAALTPARIAAERRTAAEEVA